MRVQFNALHLFLGDDRFLTDFGFWESVGLILQFWTDFRADF